MENRFYSKQEINNFQTKRNIIYLYKTFLVILEDLQEEHIANFQKLYNNLEENKKIINQADYFDEDKMTYLRKKILDAGNDCIRSVFGDKNYEKYD